MTVKIGAGDESRSASSNSLRLQILGPLRLWRGNDELDPGPRQQAYLLALLLVRPRRPTSTSELIELMWGDAAPASAVNVLHKYIGALRRIMEPALLPRDTGSHLVRRGDGYLFVVGSAMLDVVTFHDLVEAARIALSEQRHEAALDAYAEALRLWNGPAGDGLASASAAQAIFAGLDMEFFDACVTAADAAVSLGRPDSVLPALHLATKMAPLHEPVHASLIAALGAAGRQGEALAVFRAIRNRLIEDLDVNPGDALQAAHRRVLHQTSPPPAGPSNVRQLAGQPATPLHTGPELSMPPVQWLVGRAEERALLHEALQQVIAGGTRLMLVEGEPGAGKSRLLKEIAIDADKQNALVIWGQCLQGDGTPSMWPWVRVVGTIVDDMAPAARQKWVSSEIAQLLEIRPTDLSEPVVTDGNAQFRLFEHVVGIIGQAASQRPLVLLIDDLHWADVASLQLFAHLSDRLPISALMIGAFRDRAPTPGTELAHMLAVASRTPAHRRIRLGPLTPGEVAEIFRRETGQGIDSGAARIIHTRTAGNPFFARELSHLLANGRFLTEDAAALAGVPSTVRDIVRSRIADLADGVKGLVQIAALIGRDVDVGLLARAANLDIQTCFQWLEPLEALGILNPTPGDPYSIRFAHDLVRDSVAAITPPGQVPRLHLRVADELEHRDREGESIPERIAYHLWAAGPLADAARTACALVRAGRRAAAKFALEAAERHLHSAVQVARTAGLAELELSALSELTAVVGMRSMHGVSAVSAADLLERAEQVAHMLGREREATGFLFSRWVAAVQYLELERGEPLARRLLEQGRASSDPVVRAYGLQAWGNHQWQVGNIGEAFRHLSQSEPAMLAAQGEDDPVWRDVQQLMTGIFAEISALHGGVDAARALLDTLAPRVDDTPYKITVWAAFVARTASVVGDHAWALDATEQGIAADPGFSFEFLGTYQRLARCWALAMTGQDPAAAATEAERLITANLRDPPRSCVATWYGLLAEMRLGFGALDDAAAALDQADYCLTSYGQRQTEGLILLLRAQLLRARGRPIAEIRAVAERARALSTEREVHLFAQRAAQFLSELE